MKMRKFYIFCLFFLGIAGLRPAISGDKHIKQLFSDLEIESLGKQKAPPFHLLTLAGDTLSLDSYDDSLLIVHFWATWCVPCRKEMPEMSAFADANDSLPVVFIGISVDDEKDVPKVPGAVQQMGVNFPIAIAAKGKIDHSYWTWGVPVTYFISTDRQILGRILGPRSWQDPKMLQLLRLLTR